MHFNCKKSKVRTQPIFFENAPTPQCSNTLGQSNVAREPTGPKKVQRAVSALRYYFDMKKIRALYVVENEAREDDFHTFRHLKEAEGKVNQDRVEQRNVSGVFKASIRKFVPVGSKRASRPEPIVWPPVTMAEFRRMADELDMSSAVEQEEFVRRVNQLDGAVVVGTPGRGIHRVMAVRLSGSTLPIKEPPYVPFRDLQSAADAHIRLGTSLTDEAFQRLSGPETVSKLCARLAFLEAKNKPGAGSKELLPSGQELKIARLCEILGGHPDGTIENCIAAAKVNMAELERLRNKLPEAPLLTLEAYAMLTADLIVGGNAAHGAEECVKRLNHWYRESGMTLVDAVGLAPYVPTEPTDRLSGQTLYNELIFGKVPGDAIDSAFPWFQLRDGTQDRFCTVAYRIGRLLKPVPTPTPIQTYGSADRVKTLEGWVADIAKLLGLPEGSGPEAITVCLKRMMEDWSKAPPATKLEHALETLVSLGEALVKLAQPKEITGELTSNALNAFEYLPLKKRKTPKKRSKIDSRARLAVPDERR